MNPYTRTGRAELIERLQAYDAAVERIRTRMGVCERNAASIGSDGPDRAIAVARIQTYELVLAELEGRPM